MATDKLDLTKREVRIPYWQAEAAKLVGAVIVGCPEISLDEPDDPYATGDMFQAMHIDLPNGKFIETVFSMDDEVNGPGHAFIEDDRVEELGQLTGGTITSCQYVEKQFKPYLTLVLEVTRPGDPKPVTVEIWKDPEGNSVGALLVADDSIGRGMLPELS